MVTIASKVACTSWILSGILVLQYVGAGVNWAHETRL